MADNKPKPKRRLKPAQTVRERTQNSNETKPKVRKFNKTRSRIRAPFKLINHRLRKFKVYLKIITVSKFIGRIIIPVFLRNAWKELMMVVWPTRKIGRKLTMAVLVSAIILGAFIASVDYGLGHLFKLIILGKKG